MSSVRSRYESLLGKGSSTERVVFFSDAVFAIAMTLLVLDIRVPEGTELSVDESLIAIIPKVFAYVLSFAIIAVNWTSHHRKFTVITGYDRHLISLNLALLLVVAFVPFPTALLAEAGDDPAAVVLYAATVGLLGVMQYIIWAYARRAGLLSASVDLGVYRLVRRAVLAPSVVFGVSIVVALLGQPLIAMFTWFLIAPSTIIAGRAFPARADDLDPAVTHVHRG
jgi:uncharacterized membrane protein